MINSTEYQEKYDYVRTTLTEALRKMMHNEHYRAEYHLYPNGNEIVEISFDNELSIRKVDVTADSLLAITRDVLKAF